MSKIKEHVNLPVNNELQNRILDFIAQSSADVTAKMIQDSIIVGTSELAQILNNLNRADKIEFFLRGKQIVYKAKNLESAKSYKGSDTEEKLIYQLIEKSGNKGIWIRDLRFASNLSQTQVNKILKSLENQKLIKSIKSVAASKKKVYMLYDIEPDRTVTGGTWYSDQEFESEFVDVLNQQCYRYLQQAKTNADKHSDPIMQINSSYKSSKDICNYINELKISKVELSVQDIEAILDSLVYDGKIEKTPMPTSASTSKESFDHHYRIIKPLVPSVGLMRMPCGVCMVFDDCHEGGIVSPTTCPYMKEWLEY